MFVVFFSSAAFCHVGSAPVLVRELADGARTSLRNNSFPFKQDRLGRPQNIFASVYICR